MHNSTVVPFPRKQSIKPRYLSSFNDLVPTDPAIDARAAELRAEAVRTLQIFPSEVIADVLAYAAARLERTGFAMFPASDRAKRF